METARTCVRPVARVDVRRFQRDTTLRVLVTGHRGYIGSVLTTVLTHSRFEVVGLDSDLYQGCDFGRATDDVASFDMDIRDVEYTDLLSFDAVIHLAALTDDGATSNAALMDEINHLATIRLAEQCKKAGVSRFVFASSCSVYGRSPRRTNGEVDQTNPIGAYAQSKLQAEHGLRQLADEHFMPVLMRCATAYGVSPRLRMDTVVNDFVASSVVQGRINMRTAGTAWRPLVHVEDVARAYASVLTAPSDKIADMTFNLAAPGENYRIVEVAEKTAELMPSTTWTATDNCFDERTYKVDGTRLLAALPHFEYRWSLGIGIRQLVNAISGAGVSPGEWRSDRYRRSLRLRKLVEMGCLSRGFRKSALSVV